VAAVAVHVVLGRDQVRSIMSLYHLDDLEDFAGIAEGSINTSYWVRSDGEDFFLRITENKTVRDMIFEKELLVCLRKAGLPVPELIPNVAGGTFTPWSNDGRFVSLFRYMEGRELGAFEVRPHHVRQVAQFAARMHAATEELDLTRKNEFSRENLARKMSEMILAVEGGRLDARFAPELAALSRELDLQSRRDVEHLPRGTVHGDLFVDNAKFDGDELSGMIDFEMAATERLVWELAVMINAWCWVPSAEQHGGPAGRFDPERVQAALEGYASVRSLEAAELEALAPELRLAAARFAITRLYDFELNPLPSDRRVYKDYRHYMARLSALSEGRAEQIVSSAS
jgi:homoserine kinase type II